MHAITTLKCSFPESGGFGGSEVYMGEISSKVLYRYLIQPYVNFVTSSKNIKNLSKIKLSENSILSTL